MLKTIGMTPLICSASLMLDWINATLDLSSSRVQFLLIVIFALLISNIIQFFILQYEKSKQQKLTPAEIQDYNLEILKKEKIVTQIVHDLRSPIAAILSLSHAIKDICSKDRITKDERERLSESSSLMKMCIQRLNSICTEVLKTNKSKIQESQDVKAFQPLLKELLLEFCAIEQYKKLNFVNQTKGYDFLLDGDSTKIFRVLQNIIKNAAEAMMFNGDITISLGKRSESILTSRKSVQVVIADTGPGLTKKDIKKILTTSFTKGKKDGHGIGLQFVKETMYAHNGRIKIKSKPGKGTKFIVELPAYESKRFSSITKSKQSLNNKN